MRRVQQYTEQSSLVEDDDGLRWLQSPGQTIVTGLWERAVEDGVSGIFIDLGDGTAAITIDRFVVERREARGAWVIDDEHWSLFTGMPTYADLVLADEQAHPVSDFVHVHTHSEMSSLDGLSNVKEIVTQVQRHGQQAVVWTDHGNCAVHPSAQRACDEAGIKAVFGIEAYFVHDRHLRPDPEVPGDAQRIKDDYHHLILIAQNNTGLRNVWAASTESFRDGQYYQPRMDWDTLEHHAEGVICTTGCLRGPVAGPINDGDHAKAEQNLSRLHAIYGDRLYVEIHSNSLPEQKTVNQALVVLARKYDIPIVVAVDAHYPRQEDYLTHQAWISVQIHKDMSEDGDLFAHDIGLYMKSEQEVREALAYLDDDVIEESIVNTKVIADQCDARIEKKSITPIYSANGGHERDAERLLDMCLENWTKIKTKRFREQAYIERFEQEFPLLVSKKFCGYFLMVADYVKHAKDNHILVGPGRGSGGGSLVAYLCNITEVDPVEAELLFERFMTEGRTELPDFDIDFPTSRRDFMQDYVTDKYGYENVIRVGTHTRLRNKGVIASLTTAMASVLPESAFMDMKAVSNIIKAAEAGTAGLGLTWEQLWVQEEETLAPYLAKYPDFFEMAERLVGRLKTYGRHAAGLVISTEESLIDALPLRIGEGEDAQMISQFEMEDLAQMGLVKFDFLTIRTLDTVQDAIDLIYERRGIRIDPYTWEAEYEDPQVWDELGDGNNLGVFQVETRSGISMTKRMRPISLAELSDVLTLVRPGPMRSGLTDLYLERRAGESEIDFPDPRMAESLGSTYGVILYQEQVLQTCMILAGYTSDEADKVRKILGKKQVEKVAAAGRQFIEGCAEGGMPRAAAELLWSQMAEFAKYSFGKAHAYAYGMISYWTAWLRVHFPIEMFASLLSTVEKDRIPEFVTGAMRLGLQVLPPDINQSGQGFQATPFGSTDVGVRYGLDSLKGIGASATQAVLAAQPFISLDDFLERKTSAVNSGAVSVLAKVGALDTLEPNRRGLETVLLADKTGASSQCVFKEPGFAGPQHPDGQVLPCHFDWDNEPAPVNPKTGKKQKRKPLPKKCTKACRNYTAPPPMKIEDVEHYTDEDIRQIEVEMLGVYLSSTPFDRIEDEEREACREQAQLVQHGPPGTYLLLGTIARIKEHTTRNGEKMAFMTLTSEVDDHEMSLFPTTWDRFRPDIKIGLLSVVEVEKNHRGLALTTLYVV